MRINSYEYITIEYLIFWHPPESIRHIWAEHLYEILTKVNKEAPEGWLCNLLYPIVAKKPRALPVFEKDMILHLHHVLQLVRGHGLIKLLRKMWKIDDKTIRSCLSMTASNKVKEPIAILPKEDSTLQYVSEEENKNVSNATLQNFETPHPTRKRKEGDRTPLTNEREKYKQSVTFATPQRINNLKAYPNEGEGFVSCSVEGLVLNVAENFMLDDNRTVPGQCNSNGVLLDKSNPKPMEETNLRNSEEVISTIAIPKLFVDRYAQTYAVKKNKRYRRQTILKINKTEATIKIQADNCDVEQIVPAFESAIEQLDEKQEDTIRRPANKIGSIIAISSDNNPNTAIRVLTKVLTSDTYQLVKILFEELYMPAGKKNVSGIKSFVTNHSSLPKGGTRLTVEQNAIDAVI